MAQVGRFNVLSVVTTLLVAAASYAVAGLAVLALVPSLGLVFPVWPAAGIAFALVYQRGRAAAVGVAAGAFLVAAVRIVDDALLDAGQVWLTAALVAVGAALQAVLGAGLVRQRYGLRPSLSQSRQILTFLALAGPVACVAGATVAIAAELATGALEPDQAALAWVTWWAGDTIGVVVVAPVVLMLLPEQRDTWQGRRWKVAVPSLAIALLLVAVVEYNQNLAQQRAELRQRQLVAMALADLGEKAALQTEVLLGVSGLFAASETVTPEEFREFTVSPVERYPALNALSWNPRVTRAGLDAFVAAQRAYPGLADFQVTQKSATGDLVPAGDRAEYVVVALIEPVAENTRVLGYDIASDPVRAVAIAGALDTGLATATAPITLVQQGSPRGILLLQPVFDGGTDPGEAATRRAVLRGFTVGVVRVAELVEETYASAEWDSVQVVVVDASAGDEVLGTHTADGAVDPDLTASGDLTTYGRVWRIEVTPSAEVLSGVASEVVPFLLAGAVLVLLLLEAFLLLVTGLERFARRRAESLGYEAAHDPLTELLNRRGLRFELERALTSAKMEGEAHVLLFLDLDGFKAVNDRGGHLLGDRLLREIGIALQAAVRRRDAVARVGGDEFAVLLRDCGVERGLAIAHELLRAVRAQRVAVDGGEVGVGVSVGATTFGPDWTAEAEDLVATADRACYEAKRAGGGMVMLVSATDPSLRPS